MKPTILARINALGGRIENVVGHSLADDLLAIRFDTVLYAKPDDLPWGKADEAEPIFGVREFIVTHANLFRADKAAFYSKLLAQYYRDTEEGYGQYFYKPQLFTPFKEGSADFDEWNVDFIDDELIDLREICQVTGDSTPDFVQIFYSYGYPDHFYVCLSDPNPDNPTVFGTDHEVFFNEITNEGSLADFLHRFMTKEELVELVRNLMEP